LDGILKFKRAVTVAAPSYIKYMEHFRSHAKKKQHQVLETALVLFPVQAHVELKEKRREKNYVE